MVSNMFVQVMKFCEQSYKTFIKEMKIDLIEELNVVKAIKMMKPCQS